jgi:hypothetical protein
MTIAKGQLRHHFWGDYKATIVLKFHSPVLASAAVAQLPGFNVHERDTSALVFFGGGEQLKLVEALLVSLGADRKKIRSVRYSIDYGERFEIAVDLTPRVPQPTQLTLLEAAQ